MSAVGLDFGSGLSAYGKIIREAAEARRRQEQQEFQNMLAGQQSAYNYGYDSEDVQYMSIPGVADLLSDGRSPDGVDGPLANYDPNNPYPPQSADDIEADFLMEQLNQGTVENPTRKLPTGPRVTGTKGANDAPPPAGTEYKKGGTQAISSTDVAKSKENLSGLNEDEKKQQQEMSQMFDNEIESIISHAQESGLVRGNKVHPFIARQVQKLREQKFKAMAGQGRSLYEMALLADIKQRGKPAKTGSTRAPKDPTIALQRKVNTLNKLLTTRPKAPSGIMQGSKRLQDDYMKSLEAWKTENFDVLSAIEDIRRQMAGQPPKERADAKGKTVKYKGERYSIEDFKKKFPEVYEKNKAKFGG